MKLSVYLKELEKIQKLYGGNLEIVYSVDDEGNTYNPVLFAPTIAKVEKVKAFMDSDDFDFETETPNVVIIN